ncbi:hypothetical protein [Sinosporangium siamense]|uniref:Secreted protein n=1 Tax=Sinosporangium siamense TaxID=1367973 RepID=A0A919RIR4_9ACTN|nr:hypothetical protein [Sinosporangium siamense]GII92741.1 hypothetical protein Ssi02_29720 [Sinosporangium siamense]
MTLRRRVATLLGGAAFGLSAVAFTPGAAMAAPSGCTVQYDLAQRWATSHCTSGTGRHMVVVRQHHANPQLNPIVMAGPCVPVGQTSYTTITSWPVVAANWVPC